MRVRTVRKSGEHGTEKFVARYDDRQITVRYRYSPDECKRYKTVELIVAEEEWSPPPDRDELISQSPAPTRTPPRVSLRIQYFENELQHHIKAIGGTWGAQRKLWFAPEDSARRIGLGDGIVR